MPIYENFEMHVFRNIKLCWEILINYANSVLCTKVNNN